MFKPTNLKAAGAAFRSRGPVWVFVAALSTVALAATSASLSGCGAANSLYKQAKETDDLDKPTGTTPTRVIQVLEEANGAPVIAAITAPDTFKETPRLVTGGTSGYKDATIGTLALTLTDAQDANRTLAQVTADIGTPADYKTAKARTILVYGTAGDTGEDAPKTLVVSDPALPATSEAAFVRVVVLSSNVGVLGLYNGDKPVIGATRIVSLSPTGYLAVPADATLTLKPAVFATPSPAPTPTPTPTPTPAPDATPTPAPTPDPSTPSFPALAAGTPLVGGRAYTIVVYGKLGSGLNAIIIPEQ